MQKEIHKRCFVIGPMKDMKRLHTLANKIVKPILEPRGFKVITPEEGTIGTVMDQVLLNLEQADILVADITGNNPNVMYELGVYHSFGKPSIIVKEIKSGVEAEQTPFDIAAYRFIEINLTKVKAAIDILRPRFEDILNNIGQVDWFHNPVTRFYNSPIAEIPTAIGLSKNYIKNFLQMMLPHLFRKQEFAEGFELTVAVEGANKEFVPLDAEARKKLKFEVLVPKKMQMAHHDYIRNLKEWDRLGYKNAKVFRLSREFMMHIRFEDDGTPVLVDIPTVLATLNESIQHRRGLQQSQINNSKEWDILEAQELERFATKCEQFKKRLENEWPSIQGRVSVVWYWNHQNETSNS
ncbi:STING domain-containing protein [Emticicia sp. 17c]|uniref:STING domain-containing protein n=1 Tax=Emticicia sp. 17c TaxID=3127704 RepID=UPI00301B9D1D